MKLSFRFLNNFSSLYAKHILCDIILWHDIFCPSVNHHQAGKINLISTISTDPSDCYTDNSILFCLYCPLLDIGRYFSYLIYTHLVGLLRRGISLSQGLYLHTEQNKHTHTSKPRVGLKPTTLVFKRAKTVHALDSVATVIYCKDN
jgi:hypothetical protein